MTGRLEQIKIKRKQPEFSQKPDKQWYWEKFILSQKLFIVNLIAGWHLFSYLKNIQLFFTVCVCTDCRTKGLTFKY